MAEKVQSTARAVSRKDTLWLLVLLVGGILALTPVAVLYGDQSVTEGLLTAVGVSTLFFAVAWSVQYVERR